KFVQDMGDKMNYHVVQDDAGGSMANAWMQAAGQDGIPCAFLVGKDSTIQWIGHPMELDDILKQVAAGTFDPKKEAALDAARSALTEKIGQAQQAGNFDQALSLLDQLAKVDPAHANDVEMFRYGLLLQKKDYAGASRLGNTLLDTFKNDAS